MLDKLRQLARLRSEYDTAKRHYDEAHARFVDSVKPVSDDMTRLKTDIEVFETSIRLDAVAQYKASGLKEFEGGVRIRVVKDISITDPDAAMQWAIQHELALSLDKKQLIELSKVHAMPFVQSVERATATIPKDIVILGDE